MFLDMLLGVMHPHGLPHRASLGCLIHLHRVEWSRLRLPLERPQELTFLGIAKAHSYWSSW